jgi:8-hydroxy-5-deazaflavin:NADPH oxidoreductase
MGVAIVGSGIIGRTLGGRLAAAGEDVVFGLRDVAGASAAALAEALPGAATAPLAAAIGSAEAVVLAVPGDQVPAFAEANADAIGERVVVDATNDTSRGPGGPFHHMDDWARLAPRARVFRAFSTMGWEVFAEPVLGGARADLFYCGPSDPAASAVAERLIAAVGLRPVRVGGPDAAEVVDGVARLWFALALGQGRGRHLGFALLEGGGS